MPSPLRSMRGRLVANLALALPVLAGLGYLFGLGAPPSYPIVNAGALAFACAFILAAPAMRSQASRRILIGLALVALFLPLLTGPAIGGVARWIPLGPFALHAGMLVVPTLAVLCAKEREAAPILLSIALLAASLQPDLATVAAVMLASVGLYEATQDWRHGLVAIVAFAAGLVASVRGELPAQPFADYLILPLALTNPLVALGLLAALVAGFLVLLKAGPGEDAPRKALAGSLFGFSFAGLVSNYPSALIGYGASPILGFGLALGILAASGTGGRIADLPAEDLPVKTGE